MPQWFGQLSDKDIDGIIAYLLSLQPWEDADDQAIPPSNVQADPGQP
ncbi:MAG: hypothetical protein HYV35_10500 [Lentisphaerae bacterium]|nr:hypothetical protein [Lentisphaerota bacterium]